MRRFRNPPTITKKLEGYKRIGIHHSHRHTIQRRRKHRTTRSSAIDIDHDRRLDVVFRRGANTGADDARSRHQVRTMQFQYSRRTIGSMFGKLRDHASMSSDERFEFVLLTTLSGWTITTAAAHEAQRSPQHQT